MLKRAEVKIEGTKVFLFHTFPINALSEKKTKSGATGNNPEEWKETVLADDKKRLFVYDTYLTKSISEGAKEIKVGRGSLSPKVASVLEIVNTEGGKIFFENLLLPEDPSKLDHDDVYIDVRSVKNPMTNGRNVRYRVALKPGWHLSFTVQWEDSLFSKDQMRLCIENGGVFQGIGDGRKLGFGRYKVLSFSLV